MSTLYRGGRIFTAVPGHPFAEAMLVEGERIVFVGDEAAAREVAASGSHNREPSDREPSDLEVVDLEGRMLMPGIHDAHTHLLMAGLKLHAPQEVALTPFANADQIVAELLQARAEGRVTDDGWLLAGDVFPTPPGEERIGRTQLDAAFPDIAVLLLDYSQHHIIVNSRALELAGIPDDPAPVHGGTFVRDENGRLTGELVERATWAVRPLVPKPRQEVVRETLEWSMESCLRFGITSVQEAGCTRAELDALTEFDREGALKLRVFAHLVLNEEALGQAPRAELEALIDASGWASERLNTSGVKIILDGAPLAPNETQSTLVDGEIDEDWIMIPAAELAAIIDRYDAEGRLVKIHCSGTGAARAAINAIAAVREKRPGGLPHEIAHAGFVERDDLERMSRLGITAEMSPALWHIPEYHLEDGFKFADVLATGVRMTIGTDWLLIPEPNLFPGLQGTVEHAMSPIDLLTALDAVTRVGALQIGSGDERGTLEAGKVADYIVLDRDLFSVPSGEIGGTRVLHTVIGGETVFSLEE